MKLKKYWLAIVIVVLYCNACQQNSQKNVTEKPLPIVADSSYSQALTISNETTTIKVELSEGNIDGYWIRLPFNYSEKKSWPVLVYFHGAGLLERKLDSIQNAGPATDALRDTSNNGILRNQIFSNFILITPHLKGTGKINPPLNPS